MSAKTLLLSWLMVLLIVSSVAQAVTFTVEEDALALILPQGSTKTATFTVKNTDDSPLNIAITHDLDLIDNDGDKITLSFSNPGEIPSGSSSTITLTADADNDIDFETYQGTITVKEVNGTNVDTIGLSIQVEQTVCDEGEVGHDLELQIDDPDEDDEFEPGDIIDVKVTVKNVGDDDIRTKVGAFLFSDKSQITNAASGTINIEDGEEEEFEVSLKIPFDSNKVDDKDDLNLFIKAFDDDAEELNCVQETLGLSIKLSSKKVIIDKPNTKFLPSSASCGDTVLANIHVINIGEKDNDAVTVSLSNKDLGINQKSDPFTLEAFSSDEDNDETRQFTINIPDDIQAKTYYATALVNYQGGSTSEQIPLHVMDCDTPSSLVQGGETLATITPVQPSFTVNQGSLTNIPVKIMNALSDKATFIIMMTNIGDVGTTAPKTITLNGLQESTVFMDLRVNEDTELGTHTGVIEVRWEGNVIATETVALEVQQKQETSQTLGGFYGAIPLWAWIVIDLIVIGILVVVVTIVMKKRKH